MADLGVLDAVSLLRKRSLSAAELLAACLERIEARNGGPPSFDGAPDAVNAWARLYPELAAEQAAAADERLTREGEEAPQLCGIPLGLKDLYGVAGLPLTASSRILDGHVADADSEAWRRLHAQGMVLVGHTHTHEFACGGTTDQVGNPRALDRSAGGSSGGSAAAVAAGMVPAATGTDTCGSLRIPAALCGVSAIKPTHGQVPMDGIVPLAPTLDHAGPIAATIADCSALLAGLTADGDELPQGPRAGGAPLAGLTIALTDRPEALDVDPEVVAGLETARAACEGLGARIVERPAVPRFPAEHMTTILLTETWRSHAGYAERSDDYRPSVREFVTSSQGFQDAAAYAAAQERRTRFTAEWDAWFETVDLLLEPTVPILAPPRGTGYDPGGTAGPGDPLIELTDTWDLTGFPVAALPVPAGRLPVGVSLVAPRGAQALLIQAAIDLQEHAFS
jgi:aspartyl-tRNA(Asn)/glutamyl-tRNA(Gln) amidotransferase subunit A